MFHEAGRGKDLWILALGDVCDAPILVEEDRARAGRPLVERHDIASHAGLPPSSPYARRALFRRSATGGHASIQIAQGSSELNGAASATTSQRFELRADAVQMRLRLA